MSAGSRWIDDPGDARLARSQATAFDENGVDLTLIDWMLSLSPLERLEAMQVHGRSLASLLPDAQSD
jgi:hypothetical protein